MSKLLRANFNRLWKNKLFWGCIIFMFLDASSSVISQYVSFKNYGGEIRDYFNEGNTFAQTLAAAIISAIFIGLFIGTEHSNGTLRNKLVIGHSRGTIYFANLAVCAAASLMIHAVYFLTALFGGLIASGNFISDIGTFTGNFAVSLIIVTAFAAMFLPISSLVSSKSAGTTAVIITSLVLVIFGVVIAEGLTEPQINEAYTITDSSGNEISEPETVNPFYVSGVQREIYEVLYDILPTCQAVRLQLGDMPENPAVIPLWSAAVIIVTTGAGVILFRRKDLK